MKLAPVTLTGSMEFPIDTVDLSAVKAALEINFMPMGATEPIQLDCYEIDGTVIRVPRQFGLDLCQREGIQYVDATSTGQDVKFPRTPKPRDYQVSALDQIEEATDSYYDFIFRARTGWGKCQIRGTKILMFDGTIKNVEDIIVGDCLMGPDSKAKRVLSLASGQEEMFTVTPKKGQAYTFNRSHILSLKATANSGSINKNEIVNVEISEYINWSAKQKHLFKLWRTGVDFPESQNAIKYDPYFVGLYLGDGTKRSNVQLHIGDARLEVHSYIRQFASYHGMTFRESQVTGCLSFVFAKKNNAEFIDFIQCDLLTHAGERHIPHEYLTASRVNRLRLLAGLIDTDGHLYSNCYDFIAKDKSFAEQVCFLARSLGLAAYMSESQKKAQGWSETKTYYRIKISGNTDMIPVLTPSRKASPRAQKKNVLVTGFSIESVGVDTYYGFTLDGDHLYLLGDFTVTHNTIGSLIVASRLGKSTLILVDQENLKDQWIDSLVAHFGFSKDDVGIIQGKRCDYEGRAVTIAMVQTLSRKEFPPEVWDYFGTVIVDEVHIIGAPTFSVVLLKLSAMYRIGVSATPKRRDSLQKVLDYNLGRVRVYIEDEHDESAVYVVEHNSVYSEYANRAPKIGRFINEIAEDASRNLLIAELACYLYDTGRDILVLSDRIEHLTNLCALCYYLGVPSNEMGVYAGYNLVYGYEKDSKPMRQPPGLERGCDYTPIILNLISKRAKKRELDQTKTTARIIFSTYGKFSKGVDEPRLSGGVDATPRSTAEQVQGRILRKVSGKLKPIWMTVTDPNSYRSLFSLTCRIPDYIKNNASVSKWSLERGKVKCDVTQLKKDTLREVAKLKKYMQIQTNSAGLNTLVTVRQPTKLVSDPEPITIRNITRPTVLRRGLRTGSLPGGK